MTDKGIAIIIVTAIVALVLIGLAITGFGGVGKTRKNSNDNLADAVSGLNGLWVAGDEFCSKAGIDGMIMYIGETDVQKNEAEIPACIIMHADNKTLAFKKFTIVFNMKEVNENKKIRKIKFPAKIQESENNEEDTVSLTDIFPTELQISYKPFKSNLIFYEILDGKKNVYANLVKDNVSFNNKN